MNTAGAPARRRGRAWRRRAQRRGRRGASPVITRLSLERQLGLPPPVPQVSVSDLFNSVPPLLQSPSGVYRHVVEGYIVQESCTPFTTRLSLEARPESEQAVRDRRPGQQPCAAADPDILPASDSEMATPPPPTVAQDASDRTPAVTFVSPDRPISHPARSETQLCPGADNVQPTPPQEHEHAVQQEETRQHEQRYVFVGRQAGRHRDPNRSVPSSTVVSHCLPNVASRSTNRVTAGNDGIVLDVPCPHCPSNTIVNIVH
ncbi:hypothetical protein HPB50_021125 [Hyalomma asiaticum]|uniref:Uncharacterized protein n=1 Tax=Hyalomma asiaticum TaxID=266040 RepID=A0ACB7TNZ7_HYAAI|nr:hypothetical protein HPB50_021125 [Hyalomma asiaticum]